MSYEAARKEADLPKILELADAAFQKTVRELDSEHRGEGVFFRVGLFVDTPMGYVLVPLGGRWVAGSANRLQEVQYRAFSAEKALRLFEHQYEGHVSALESRTEGLSYRGAVCFSVQLQGLSDMAVRMVLSASGLPEIADEVGCIRTAFLLKEHIPNLMILNNSLTRLIQVGGHAFADFV